MKMHPELFSETLQGEIFQNASKLNSKQLHFLTRN